MISEYKAETPVCGNWWMKRFVYSTIALLFLIHWVCSVWSKTRKRWVYKRRPLQMHQARSTDWAQRNEWASNTVTSQRYWLWLQPAGWKDKSGRMPVLLLAWLLCPHLSPLVQAHRRIALSESRPQRLCGPEPAWFSVRCTDCPAPLISVEFFRLALFHI